MPVLTRLVTDGVASGIWRSAEAHGPGQAVACLPPFERDGLVGAAPLTEAWSMGTVFGAFETPARFGRLASQGSLEAGSTAHWAAAVEW